MTVLEVIQRSAEFLDRKGVDAPRLQVELLLAHTLGVPRLKLYLDFDRQLTEPQLAAVRDLVKRRGEREPLQHIVGTTSFCGLDIKVNRHVLVPRPETELLAERACEFLRSLKTPAPAVFDFGTGSGCIAIALAAQCPNARVHAADLSADALAMARESAALNGVGDRIQFYAGDGFAAVEPGLRFDLIVANPPYIPSGEIDSLMPEVRDYDPRRALDGGPDGLIYFRRLAAEAGARLAAAGRIMLEFGDGQAENVSDVFVRHKWIVERIEADYSGRPRTLVARPERV